MTANDKNAPVTPLVTAVEHVTLSRMGRVELLVTSGLLSCRSLLQWVMAASDWTEVINVQVYS